MNFSYFSGQLIFKTLAYIWHSNNTHYHKD